MNRFIIHTNWGGEYGVKTELSLVEFVNDMRARGYICVPQWYIAWPAVCGVEDQDVVEAMEEAATKGRMN